MAVVSSIPATTLKAIAANAARRGARLEARCEAAGISAEMLVGVFPNRDLGTFGSLLEEARVDRALYAALAEAERSGEQMTGPRLAQIDAEQVVTHRAAHPVAAWWGRALGAWE